MTFNPSRFQTIEPYKLVQDRQDRHDYFNYWDISLKGTYISQIHSSAFSWRFVLKACLSCLSCPGYSSTRCYVFVVPSMACADLAIVSRISNATSTRSPVARCHRAVGPRFHRSARSFPHPWPFPTLTPFALSEGRYGSLAEVLATGRGRQKGFRMPLRDAPTIARLCTKGLNRFSLHKKAA